jgi:hypothetical protein
VHGGEQLEIAREIKCTDVCAFTAEPIFLWQRPAAAGNLKG